LHPENQIIVQLPQEQLERDRVYAQLAAAAYKTDEPVPVPVDWEDVLEFDDPRHTGYFARLFVNRVTQERVLAYAGTDDWPNWWTNFTQATGQGGIEYDIGMEHAQQVVDGLPPGAELRFVGHSLGGGMATLAAAIHQRRATTFNAAGVHSYTVFHHRADFSDIDQRVDAYRVKGEVLSTLQDARRSFVGVLVPNGNGKDYWLPPTALDPVGRHYMADVLAGFDRMIGGI
jgi:hypothetical protein